MLLLMEIDPTNKPSGFTRGPPESWELMGEEEEEEEEEKKDSFRGGAAGELSAVVAGR